MGQKDKWVFSTLIVLIVVIAGVASFGMGIMGDSLPEIKIPSLDELGWKGELSGEDISTDFVQVSVTPKTVQNVIATIERRPSYTGTVTMRMHYDDQVSLSESTVWVDGEWTRVMTSLPNQTMGNQHTIVGGEMAYRWYDYDRAVSQWYASENTADIAQRIPSYHDVLELDVDQISAAGYVEKNGYNCIYVETFLDGLNYWEKYWVSVDTGLLVWAETYYNDQLILQVESGANDQASLTGREFTLPNGKVLYQP